MELAIGAAIGFVGAGIFGYIAALGAPRAQRSPGRRLMNLVEAPTAGASEEEGAANAVAQRQQIALTPLLESLAMSLAAGSGRKQLIRRLQAAGVSERISPAAFFGLRVVGAFAGLLLGSVVFAMVDPKESWRTLAAAITACVLAAGPDIWLRDETERRQKAIRRSLPDVLDLLVVSVEVGLGFDAAVAKVTGKMQGPLIEEMGKLLRDMQLGQTRGEALKAMAQRCDVKELNAFVGAIVQAEQLGGSLATALRTQSRAMRVRYSQRLREQAAKLPIKMLFPLVMFIFPAIFIVLLGPGILTLMETFTGK